MPNRAQYPLILTTTTLPSFKTLNRLLLLIRDYEYTDPDTDCFAILTSRMLPTSFPPVATPPLPEDAVQSNEFGGMSLDEVWGFMSEEGNEAKVVGELGLTSGLFVVVDDRALQRDECIIVERFMDFGDEDEDDDDDDNKHDDDNNPKTHKPPKPAFNAARVPFSQAWIMLANLHVANMFFLEYVDEDAGVQPDGTYTWRAFPSHPEPEVEKRHQESARAAGGKRERAVEEARGKGWVD